MTTRAFNSLDFQEAREIARLTGFDIMKHARKMKSCGPGCRYLSQDKRFYVTKLLQHVEARLREGNPLSPRCVQWACRARSAVREYRLIEKRLGHIRPANLP